MNKQISENCGWKLNETVKQEKRESRINGGGSLKALTVLLFINITNGKFNYNI